MEMRAKAREATPLVADQFRFAPRFRYPKPTAFIKGCSVMVMTDMRAKRHTKTGFFWGRSRRPPHARAVRHRRSSTWRRVNRSDLSMARASRGCRIMAAAQSTAKTRPTWSAEYPRRLMNSRV